MLNERRVKLMTRMAMYEAGEGREDFKISAYYQKDYSSLNTWITVIWSTIGYAVIAGAGALMFLEDILNNLTFVKLLMLGGAVIIGYVMTVVIAGIIAHDFYRRKHIEARKRVKKYNRDLLHLGKLYEKENR